MLPRTRWNYRRASMICCLYNEIFSFVVNPLPNYTASFGQDDTTPLLVGSAAISFENNISLSNAQ